MDAIKDNISLELREMRKELEKRLKKDLPCSKIRSFIVEELRDIDETLKRIETGKFGFCEISGEPLPANILRMIPTIKTSNDLAKIEEFFCKSLYSP